jgi:hypothetical protein
MSRRVHEPKLDKEKPDDYEKRTWRLKTHVNSKGNVIIPPIAFKFALETAAAMLRERIPGKGQSEYGKHFKAGILVTDEVVVANSREELHGEWFDMNANGRRGPGTRVLRCLPQIAEWKGIVNFYIIDDTIPEDVFERYLREAGKLVGIGQFRPQNGGYCGRFQVDKVTWE